MSSKKARQISLTMLLCNSKIYYYIIAIFVSKKQLFALNSKIKSKGKKKMLSIVKSMSLHGLDGNLLNVETDISRWNACLGYSSVCQMLV